MRAGAFGCVEQAAVQGCRAAKSQGNCAFVNTVELKVRDACVDTTSAMAAVGGQRARLGITFSLGVLMSPFLRATYLISEPSASDIQNSVAPNATSFSQMT